LADSCIGTRNGGNFSWARDVTGEVWKCQSGLDRKKVTEDEDRASRKKIGRKSHRDPVRNVEKVENVEKRGKKFHSSPALPSHST
jgi:hypothetical protein